MADTRDLQLDDDADDQHCVRCDDGLEESPGSENEEKAEALGLCLRCWEEDQEEGS